MRDYLICTDSDGCVMDTMTVKHTSCFGPCFADEWDLNECREDILKRWNEINLYSMTRGINRFPGLLMILKEVNDRYRKIEGLDVYKAWVENTGVFSEASLKEAISCHPDEAVLKKVLVWSQEVNRRISCLRDEDKPVFDGAREALERARESADIAVISTTNREALEGEWNRSDLMRYTDHCMAQDSGTKAVCLEKMIGLGYLPDHVLMIGDAMGDYEAAEKAGVSFYPVLAGKETESWKKFAETVLGEFKSGRYDRVRQAEEIRLFFDNFSK